MLSQITGVDNSFVLYDKDPAFLKYIPKNKSSGDCAHLAAGIILGILESAGFPCKIEV